MRWRKSTWAIVIWTALNITWLLDSLMLNPVPSVERYGAFMIIFGGLSHLMLWSIGLLVLGIVWLKSKPKEDTVIIYDPQGQWMRVTGEEAKRRVEKEAWTYQPATRHHWTREVDHRRPRLRHQRNAYAFLALLFGVLLVGVVWGWNDPLGFADRYMPYPVFLLAVASLVVFCIWLLGPQTADMVVRGWRRRRRRKDQR